MALLPEAKNCDASVKDNFHIISYKLGFTSNPIFNSFHITNIVDAIPSVLNGKLTVGTFASPIDVTNTRQYGFEIHYSGNDYDVTAIRARAQFVTTDTTATAQGALLQAANNDGINAGVLNGALIEAIGKSNANAATITTMRACLVNTEWGDYDTVTNLKTLHVRTHSRNAAGAGSFGTGYGIYIENEAVGGNGQAWDAGIYFKGTNLSAGNKAFTYGIDFTGGTYGTAEMLIGNAKIASSNNSLTFQAITDSTTFLQVLDADGGIPVFNIDTTNEKVSSPTFNATDENNALQIDGTCILRTGAFANQNVFLGEKVFLDDGGYSNIGIGLSAGENNKHVAGSSGYYNIYIGVGAGKGAPGGNTGMQNVYIGLSSGFRTTFAQQNIGIGSSTLNDATSGSFNMAIGALSMQELIIGAGNVGIGQASLNKIETGSNNVAIGGQTLRYTGTTSANNIAIGSEAGKGVIGNAFHRNVLIGTQSGKIITTGSDNIFIGYLSGINQTTNSDLLIIDNQDRASVAAELTDCLIYGIFHATPASQSLRFNVGTTTWHNATHTNADGGRASIFDFKGQQFGGEETTLARIEVGHDGVADDEKGYLDLFINDGDDGDSPTKILRIKSTGLFTDRWGGSDTNTFLGIGVCGAGNLSDLYNTGVGYRVLEEITSGTGNTMMGYQAGYRITIANISTGVGYNVLSQNIGNNNTAIGGFAGYTGDGDGCVFLGYYAGFHETGSDKLFIDNVSRTNEADGRVKALMYGVFAAAVANQSLTINGEILGSYGAKIGDGGITDFTKVEPDGTIEFNGAATVWEDLQFTISDAKVPASNFPAWEAFTTNTKEYSFAVDDYIDTKANETHHAWKLGTSGNVHLHVTTKAANATGSNRYAKFTIYLGYCDTNEVWQETSLTEELTIPTGTPALQMFYLDMGDLTLTNYVMEAEIKMRVSRVEATGGTEYLGNIFLTQAGIHLEHDTIGSRAETTK